MVLDAPVSVTPEATADGPADGVTVMVAGDGRGLFLTNRLNEPAQYVNATAAYLLVGFWPLLAAVERAPRPWLRGLALGGAVVRRSALARPQRRRGLGLAEATPSGYRETGRFGIPDKGYPSWAHPVVSDGRLYVRNQDTLLVYDIKAAAR